MSLSYCKVSQCNKTTTPKGIFIVTPSLEGWSTKAKEATFFHGERGLKMNFVYCYFLCFCQSYIFLIWCSECKMVFLVMKFSCKTRINIYHVLHENFIAYFKNLQVCLNQKLLTFSVQYIIFSMCYHIQQKLLIKQ